MSDDATGSASAESPSLGKRMKKGFESKVLIPAAVAVVSAAASYLLRKLPVILEEKVLPKLQEKGAPEAVTGVVEQAASLAGTSDGGENGSTGDGGAPRKGSSAKTGAGKGSSSEQSSAETAGSTAKAASKSDEEREEERRKREERRKERKRALERSA